MLYKSFDSPATVFAIQIIWFLYFQAFSVHTALYKAEMGVGGKKKVKGEERELDIASRSLQCTQ